MTVTCRLIALTVGRVFDVSLQDLYSDRRDARVMLPRHMGWALARAVTRRSLPEIGRMMGGRDHTTVLHGVRRIEALVQTDGNVSAVYEHLLQTLGEVSGEPQRLSGMVSFHDVDPVEAALRLIATPLGDNHPTLDEVRSLALGVLYFEQALSERLAEIAVPEARPRYLTTRRAPDAELKAAGNRVLSTWQRFQEALLSGCGTINARRSFNDALKSLQANIERT